MSDLLEIENLSVSFDTPQGELEAVRDVSFSLRKGEVLALVGESGCGKSVLCKTIMKLLPATARIREGKYPCKRSGHIKVYRKGNAKAARKAVCHGVSGSDDGAESDDDDRRTDRARQSQTPTEELEGCRMETCAGADGACRN